MMCFPKVKSVKAVLNTAHCLVKIVEQTISHRIKNAPTGKIMFDGYTVGGQHFVAVFASFMCKCNSIAEGSELKYDKHELHLLTQAA